MAKLTTVIILAIFTVLFFGTNGDRNGQNTGFFYEIVANVNVLDWLCQNNPWNLHFAWCSTTTASPTTSTTTTTIQSNNAGSTTNPGTTSTSTSSSPTPTGTVPTSAPSALESAHWCPYTNNTYLTLGQTFMAMPCILCQCTQNRNIVCNTLTCMTTLCIDNSKPMVKPGDCCATCAYEPAGATCTQNGITFPQGAIVKSADNTSQCWCQSGTIECRRILIVTITSSWQSFTNNATAYIAAIVVCLIIMLGAILCCGCGLLYYYYYHSQQQAMQQAYEQYYSNAGWQPMGEEGQFDDANAKEREATEGDQAQFEYPTGRTAEFVPPPYAVYTGPYGSEEHGKDQKYV